MSKHSHMYHKIAGGCLVLLMSSGIFVPHIASAAQCEAVYTGDATLEITTSLPQTVPGATVGLTAQLQSPSGMTPSGVLAVNVVDASGAVVDRFVTDAFDAGDTFTFSWSVPHGLRSGVYNVIAAAVPPNVSYADAFTDTSLPRASVSIAIVDGLETTVAFDVEQALMTREETSLVHARVYNATNEPYKGVLVWHVWAATTPVGGAPVLEFSSPLKAHPGTSGEASYTVPNTNQGMFYVEARINGAFSSVAEGWLIDGVLYAKKPCDTSGVALTSSSLLQALGVLGLIILGAIIWGAVRNRQHTMDIDNLSTG